MVSEELSRRPVRSYVRREGRLTAAQKRALDELWPRYGIDYSPRRIDLDAHFRRSARRTLEIGFGNGAELARRAAASPDQDFLGIEVHRPGVGRLLLELEQQSLTNVRVICHDAVEALTHQLPDACLDAVLLLFPDPWPKKRHHKRRIVQPSFVAMVAAVLREGGVLHIATDWAPYAEHIETVLAGCVDFSRVAPDSAGTREATRFERRGRKLGHEIFDFHYLRGPTDA